MIKDILVSANVFCILLAVYFDTLTNVLSYIFFVLNSDMLLYFKLIPFKRYSISIDAIQLTNKKLNTILLF
jgi:hypothetical protein